MKGVQKGKVTATPELVKLWGSEAGSYRVANRVNSFDRMLYVLYCSTTVIIYDNDVGIARSTFFLRKETSRASP